MEYGILINDHRANTRRYGGIVITVGIDGRICIGMRTFSRGGQTRGGGTRGEKSVKKKIQQNNTRHSAGMFTNLVFRLGHKRLGESRRVGRAAQRG